MANELPDIYGRVTLDDAQVSEVMGKIGAQAGRMGENLHAAGERGSLAFRGAKLASTELFHTFGVGGPLANTLAQGLTSLGSSLGIMGLAAMAAYGAWNYLNAAKQKGHEELEKSVASLLSEEGAMQKNKLVTWELQQANEAVHDIKKRILDQKFTEWVKQEREEIEALNTKLKEGKNFWQALMGALASPFVGGGSESAFKLNAAEQKKLTDEINEKEAELAKKRAERKAQRLNELNELNQAEKQKYYDYDAIMRAETQRMLEEAEKQKRVEQMKVQAMQTTAGNYAQTFQIMSTLGTKHARNWFTMYKLAATSEALIGAYAGFNQVLRDPLIPTWLKPAMAASILGLGLAKVAAIRAQTFQGGGGGAGGGAVGTFPANPATGLPESGGGRGDVYISVNGSPFDKVQLATDVVSELYRNNGSVGGFSIQVERSA